MQSKNSFKNFLNKQEKKPMVNGNIATAPIKDKATIKYSKAKDEWDDWEIVQVGKRGRGNKGMAKDEVHARAVMKKTKNKSDSICLDIGIDICELIDFKKGDKVQMRTHKLDKSKIILEKFSGYNGFTLSCSGTTSRSLQINFTVPNKTKLKFVQRQSVSFDIRNDKKIFIDLSELFEQQKG